MAHTLQLALAGGLKASGCRAEVDEMIRVVEKFRKTRLAAERLLARDRGQYYGSIPGMSFYFLIGTFISSKHEQMPSVIKERAYSAITAF
ncbi:hypothetical protein Tcan_13297 [Toxocara canis]|uniref:Uncharacterized protein n=1 Tax=Toxocara canis TaxID=6265 RepID=A0A0B2VVX5_TOXCA|nr:hypothetical protein Tcan_13297 [Toxocara canis]